jgi:BirA family biotin operon repressor/biotin-[acetyl-CoA-carboxylase] ligase
MDAERLKELVGPYAAVDVVESVDSTNTRLVASAAAGAPDRTVLIARRQTAGQGRRSRGWVSPRDTGIYLSVLLRPTDVPAPRLSWLSPLAGVALVRTARWAGAEAVLKWPNDLLLGPDRGKGAGVLAEVTGGAVVLGIGLNVGPLPDNVAAAPGGLAPTSLAEAGAHETDVTRVAIMLLTELATLEGAWRDSGGDPAASGLRAEFLDACATIGQQVRVELVNTMVTGVATGVADDGSLVLRADDGMTHTVSAGDVVHVRPVT